MLNHDNLNAPRSGPVPSPVPARHSRKCEICRHPDRQAIELEFLSWRHPENIVDDYELTSRSSIYRHAHATGLLAQRRLNLRDSLELALNRHPETREGRRILPLDHYPLSAALALPKEYDFFNRNYGLLEPLVSR